MKTEDIAHLCHELNRAYCETQGDTSNPLWRHAPEWQKKSAIAGVEYHLHNNVTPEQSHESWMKQKEQDGWVYGEKKDPAKKTHPCMVPYDQLPEDQLIKDHLFKAVCDIFK